MRHTRSFRSILLLTAFSLLAATALAQPKLVVGIVIDGLSLDNLETNLDIMGPDGFHRFWNEGLVYTNGSYTFENADRSSATATICTGSTPYYHGLVANRFLERKSLKVMPTIDAGVLTTTMADELKTGTRGSGYVLSVAVDRDMAIIGGGHAPNIVLWMDTQKGAWNTSTSVKVPVWVDAISYSNDVNDAVTALAGAALTCTPLGLDGKPDMLFIGLRAEPGNYRDLDFNIGSILHAVDERCGMDNALVFLTSTGTLPTAVESDYRLPAGSMAEGELHSDRVVTMLNMYLSAIYGKDDYVEAAYLNHVFLNHELMERRQIKQKELLDRCTEFLSQMSGIKRVYPASDLLSGTAFSRVIDSYHSERSGDILLEIAPGWTLVDDRWNEQQTFSRSHVRVPVAFLGSHVKAGVLPTAIDVCAIAPTVSKLMKVRTPNGCSASGIGL